MSRRAPRSVRSWGLLYPGSAAWARRAGPIGPSTPAAMAAGPGRAGTRKRSRAPVTASVRRTLEHHHAAVGEHQPVAGLDALARAGRHAVGPLGVHHELPFLAVVDRHQELLGAGR